MRNASEPGWDGPANLRDAVRVAVRPAAPGAPASLVALGGRVHAADAVAKRHASALDAFATREGPPLGRVGERRRPPARARARGARCRPPRRGGLPVPIVVAALETDGRSWTRRSATARAASWWRRPAPGNTHPDLLRAAVDAQARGRPGRPRLADRARGPSGRSTPSRAAARPGRAPGSSSRATSPPSRRASRSRSGWAPACAGDGLRALLAGDAGGPLTRRLTGRDRRTRSGRRPAILGATVSRHPRRNRVDDQPDEMPGKQDLNKRLETVELGPLPDHARRLRPPARTCRRAPG